MTLKLKLHNLVLSKSDKIKQSHFMFNSHQAPRKIAAGDNTFMLLLLSFEQNKA